MAAPDILRDARGQGPGRSAPVGRVLRRAWGSLLHRTVIVFLVAYALTGPAIYLVYWDQIRAPA